MKTYWFYLEKKSVEWTIITKMTRQKGAIGLDRRTRVDIKENQMTFLRFQTGEPEIPN